MKKYKILLSILFILIFSSTTVLAKNNLVVYMDGNKTNVREVPIILDGKPVYSDIPAFIHKGSTLVPLRFVVEHYGANVEWNNKTKSAIVAHNGNKITMTINKNTVSVNNQTKSIDNNASPKLVNTGGKTSNTMVPLRFISESLGYEVGYDKEKQLPYINSEIEKEATNHLNDIKKETVNEKESIVIYTKNNSKVNKSSANSPKRYIFDIMDCSVDTDYKEYNLSLGGISNVRASQYTGSEYDKGEKVVRVVLDMKDNSELDIKNDNGKIIIAPIEVKKPVIKEPEKETETKEPEIKETSIDKIVKYNLTGRVSTVDIDLKNKTNYEMKYDENKNIVNITVPSDSIEFTKGEMKIQNGIVDTIKFTESGSNVDISIKIIRKLKVEDLNNGHGNKINIKMERETSGKPSDRTIAIDPGHGGSETGAYKNGVKEKEINLTVSKKVQSILESKGYNVLMTREDDSYVSLKGRPQLANAEGVDIFVSIHSNSTTSSSVTGIETFHSGGALSKALAECIQEELIKLTGANNRGAKNGKNLAVIKHSDMPANLVELGFMTNQGELDKLLDDSYQNTLSEAIVNGIEKYFSIYD